jgi:hypothetical protein
MANEPIKILGPMPLPRWAKTHEQSIAKTAKTASAPDPDREEGLRYIAAWERTQEILKKARRRDKPGVGFETPAPMETPYDGTIDPKLKQFLKHREAERLRQRKGR